MTDRTTLGIGELSRLTGVPVRTIRFYCDEGVLEAERSHGGHRRFAPDAVDRLRTVRRLRGLGLGLSAIALVLTGERSLDEAVAAERAALDVELADLAWRRASLRAVEEAGPAERALRLELLSAAQRPAARDALVAFWRGVAVAPLPSRLRDAFVDVSVPEPPADPTPAQVVAYAQMVAIAGDRSLTRRLRRRGRQNAEEISDEGALMIGVGEAWQMAGPAVAAGHDPAPGPALEHFVRSHAVVRGARDTPEFRRRLLRGLQEDQDPRVDHYWRLYGEVTGDRAALGTAHSWLLEALRRFLAAQSSRR
ncbi:MerR family transcriptional regulator [Thermomonospora echinospora]|uniref:MerR family transcriptional regulator n=1 Tax=Thermomonospora echinospora TaxID=1992 RepID=UPI00190EF050|nr:MerR family transcriptional regulator [Thermomonospora echinospora]